MTRSKGHVDAPFYAQVEPVWNEYMRRDDEGNRPLRGARVIRVTQNRPDQPKPGTVPVKLTLRIPAGAFYPLQPEAIVVVPETLTETTPVQVIAEDPHAESGEES